MKSIEESIAQAMDCHNQSIVKFLPYILQDFWEIGSSAELILDVIKDTLTSSNNLSVLDLGCGKGPVSIKLALALNCNCLGIDAIQDFIDIANREAKKNAVTDRCTFLSGDARHLIKKSGQFDIIILGSTGPIFGDYYQTLSLLKNHLHNNGIIILDDGYIEDESTYHHNVAVKRSVLLEQLDKAGMTLLKEYVDTDTETSTDYESEFKKLVTRCRELEIQYPEKKQLFQDYIQQQLEAYNALENTITCSTMVVCKT